MAAHAKLSASGSSRWLNCPGSVQAEENYPAQKSSPFALEGSMAHELADLCLQNEVDAIIHLGETVYKRTVEQDMIAPVQEYLDYVRSFETDSTILFTEERVDFSHIVPEGFGTLDAAVLDAENKICHIFDLKYGKGVRVDAFENTQAQLYGTGIQNELSFLYDIDTFVLHIVQPRMSNYSSWERTRDELLAFGREVRDKAKFALSGNAPRVPGEAQCHWCKAKGDCKTLSDFSNKIITGEFQDLDCLDATALTDDAKRRILDHRKLIEMHLKAVEASVFDSLERGESFEGYKLVEGRANRQWNKDAESYLIKAMGEDAYNKKLIGIGAAEKVLGKGNLDDLMDKPKGKITLATYDDKRSAIDVKTIEEQFNIEK